jgi:peroxiredoxin
MLNRLCIFLILFTSSFLLKSQHSINGTFIGLPNEKIMLVRTNGSKHNVIDSTRLNENGSFKFMLAPELTSGSYQLFTESGISVDLILNEENIRFMAMYDGYDQQVQVVESIENMIYYSFINLKERNLYKLDILSNVIDYYPKEDEFYQVAIERVIELRTEINQQAEEFVNNHPTTLASHFIQLLNPVFAPIDLPEDLQKLYLKNHFLDYVNFNDTVLLNSHQLNSKLIQYLSVYQDKNVDKESFEASLLSGVDTLLQKASVNQNMYTYVMEFLIGGFEAIGFEKGLEHIAQHNQLDELCVNTEKQLELQHKIELIRQLAVGKTAPEFATSDIEGNMIMLSAINAPKTLLFFWASWCPHCKEMISEINDIYNAGNNEIEVIGIAIDTSLTDLKKVISEYQIDWPVIAELDGWEGKIANQYGLAATPTIFLLDQDKTIKAKPTNKAELKRLFE